MIAALRDVRRPLGLFTVLLLAGACATPANLPPAHVALTDSGVPVNVISQTDTLKVISLNAAHSRSMGLHQVLQSQDDARANLDSMVSMLTREQADIVALQEVDGPSIWSGKFDHVNYLARAAGYGSTVRGTHMKAPGLDYGTAIIARVPLDDAESKGFDAEISLARKGFVISSLQWPGRLDTKIDVVSVHLDPLLSGARKQQVRDLMQVIKRRGRPVIVMGDLNDDWQDEDSAARLLAKALGMTAELQTCEECHTHRRMKNFVDWIMVSPEIQIDYFGVVPDEVSDHFAVSATLSLVDEDTDTFVNTL
jgi:endonuclease/exonuclease/phosphatase family metal-dependent hydrolase